MDNLYDKNAVIKKLKERGITNYSCPFCGGKSFGVDENIATVSITKDFQTIQFGTYIPAAILVCQRCGNLSFFALGTLGVLPKGDSNDAVKK